MAILQGGTFTRTASGQLATTAAVQIRFNPENGTGPVTVQSSATGRYQVTLPDGRYVAEGFNAGALVFSTAPGFVVASRDRQTFNLIITQVPVIGAIERKWKQLGGETGPLGKPISREIPTANRTGAYQRFQQGTITHKRNGGSPNAGEAFAIWGAIHNRWTSAGGVNGSLGFATTDERTTPDQMGRFNHFEGGSVYWTSRQGAHIVKGAIRSVWARLGWEKSWLGYPKTDELATPRPKNYGRFNHFEGGSVYWTPSTGAIALPKAIFTAWANLRHERGELGFPVPKSWGRNLAAFGLQAKATSVWLFEGGAIHQRQDGSVQVIRHSAITKQDFSVRSWRKHGEINSDETWFVGAQGLTYYPGRKANERRWFVTRHSGQAKVLGVNVGSNVDRITKLDKHLTHEFSRNDLRQNFSIGHAGDCDHWGNRIYVACQNPKKVAILNRNVVKLGEAKLVGNSLGQFPLGHDYLSWCAVNPCDGMLYTSDFDNVTQVFGFDMRRGYRWTKTITLAKKINRVQGGAFTPNGLLILASDDRSDRAFAHIHFFNSHTGEHLCDLKVARKWTDTTTTDQEIEGVCFAPGVPYGQPTALHTIIIKSNVPNRQAWVKHWEIPADQLAKM